METIEGLTGEQLRERATLEINNTGYYQDQVYSSFNWMMIMQLTMRERYFRYSRRVSRI